MGNTKRDLELNYDVYLDGYGIGKAGFDATYNPFNKNTRKGMVWECGRQDGIDGLNKEQEDGC